MLSARRVHDFDKLQQFSLDQEIQAVRPAASPGKTTLTSRLPPSASSIARMVAAKLLAARKGDGDVGAGAEEAVARAASGSGTPLPDATRDRFGQSLGADLGDVRVHTDASAANAAASIGARAFTFGNDIYFGRDEYDPESHDGQFLLAHEVVHTVQQAGVPMVQFKLEVSQPDDALEHEADRLAPAMIAGQRARVTGGGAAIAAKRIMRWATQPPQAVQARMYIQSHIAAARDPREIAEIIAALDTPNESEGLVTVQLPHDSAVQIVDLDVQPLLAEARARERVLGGGRDGEEPFDTRAGEAAVRDAIEDADTVAQLDRIRLALDSAGIGRPGNERAVAIESQRMVQQVWVTASALPTLLAAVAERRAQVAAQEQAEGQDRAIHDQYDREQHDRQELERGNQRQTDDQQRAEERDREGRGIHVVQQAIDANPGSVEREQIRDTLRASRPERGVHHPELLGGLRPELNAADHRRAVRLAEQAAREAREGERAQGLCRQPEGDEGRGLDDERRGDVREQIRTALVECGLAYDSACETVIRQLHSAASQDRDMAKLQFKILFAAPGDLLPGPVRAIVGALGEAAASQAARALSTTGQVEGFLTAIRHAESVGRLAISRDLNCHTNERLVQIRDAYQALQRLGEPYFTRELRELTYNYQHQVVEVGRHHHSIGGTAWVGDLFWVRMSGEACLALVDFDSPACTRSFSQWVFRSMARMALARQERVNEIEASALSGGPPAAPPPWVHRRGQPLPDEQDPMTHH